MLKKPEVSDSSRKVIASMVIAIEWAYPARYSRYTENRALLIVSMRKRAVKSM